MSRKYTSVSAAAADILRDIYGRHAAKKVARDFRVSIPAAKLWLAGRFPQARTLELKTAVDTELARIEARNTEIRKQLGLGGRRGGGEADSSATHSETRGSSALGAAREDGSAAVGLRGEVKRNG